MFIGRSHELALLEDAIASPRPELIIVYGRRRVGKSTLLHKARPSSGALYFEGLQRASQKKQIEHFLQQLADQSKSPVSRARDWREAFDALTYHISTGRKYVVLDELPWMANQRTELVALIKYFWDNEWKNNNQLTLVICGSVASFMLRHLVHSQALHNRKTLEIKLPPLAAHEAQAYFSDLRSPTETAKFLMIFGGIPKYLEQIDPRKSLASNMDRLCFRQHGFFVNEFETLFKEQFRSIHNYQKIVEALMLGGCSKAVLAQRTGISAGGGLTSYVNNLEEAGFLRTFTPVNLSRASKTQRIVLWDEWLRFYFTWVHPHRAAIELNPDQSLFSRITAKGLDTYFGLAFERLCQQNLSQLLHSLDIELSDVLNVGPYFRQRSRTKPDRGLQIDILIQRRDHVITVVECKFSSKPVGRAVIDEVTEKIKWLKAPAHTTVERILLTASGATAPTRAEGYFHQIVGLEALLAL